MTTRCPKCGRPPKRSSQANRRYWELLHAISDGVKVNGEHFAAKVWHEYCKERFLGADEMRLPNGKSRLIVRSTADLEVPDFNDYMTRVEVWASERGVWLDE